MKKHETKTFLLLSLPVLALIVFASVWSPNQQQISASKAERTVKNVRVLENNIRREPTANSLIGSWRNEEVREQRRQVERGDNGLKALYLGPIPRIAHQNGVCYRVAFQIPTNVAFSGVRTQAQNLKTGRISFGVWGHRDFADNRVTYEEIFDLAKLGKHGQVKFSASIVVNDDSQSRTVTASKVVDLMKL